MKNYKKTEHFEPIAMKCTEEQFNELKPILEKFGFVLSVIIHFENYQYLFNKWQTKDAEFITNGLSSDITNEIVYETFNAETFLKACGIVEVDKTYQLSETFVKELCKEPNIKEAFIREGIIENDKLEVGKWYKSNSGCLFNYQLEDRVYGFFIDGRWLSKNWVWLDGNVCLATPQEVKTALINEAKKRGLISGVKINQVKYNGIKRLKDSGADYTYFPSEDYMTYYGWCIYSKGQWAEIIDETIETIETIEIKKSTILNTPNDMELGKLIRKMV